MLLSRQVRGLEHPRWYAITVMWEDIVDPTYRMSILLVIVDICLYLD